MNHRILLMFGLLAFAGLAKAEGGCPDGYYPANPPATNVCYPFPDSQEAQPQQQQGRWETRWGAIAIGNTKSGGGVGLVKNASTKRKAEKAAMDKCRQTGGGKECKISLKYYNQCAVIAWGDSMYVTQGAETIEVASQLALKKCGEGTTNCKIYYADCSLPVWVQ